MVVYYYQIIIKRGPTQECIHNLYFDNTTDPTIKYFVDGNAEGTDYSGGRDFDSLNDFVKETLEVKCSLTDQDLCTDKEKSYIKKMTAKPKEDRLTQIDRLEKMAKESMKAELKIWLRQRLHILRMLEV